MTWIESIVLTAVIAAAIAGVLTFAPVYADDETLSIFGASILPAAECSPRLTRSDILRCQARQGFADARSSIVVR